jgi:hypothetical protein
MIKATLIIPTWNQEYITDIIEKLASTFGGVTEHSSSYGHWIDEEGNFLRDQITQVFVVCNDNGLSKLRKIAQQLAKDLDQDCVYLDYHEVSMELITKGG